MNYHLLLLSLLTIGTLTASDHPTCPNSPNTLRKEIALTQAGLQILRDAAIRCTHLEEAAILQQEQLDPANPQVAFLEAQITQYAAQLAEKQQQIADQEKKLCALLSHTDNRTATRVHSKSAT